MFESSDIVFTPYTGPVSSSGMTWITAPSSEPTPALVSMPAPMSAPVPAVRDVLAAVTLPRGVTLAYNMDKHGLELRFSVKPPAATRDRLKAAGWRWSSFSACWYARADRDRLEGLAPFCAGLDATPEARADAPGQSTPARSATDARSASPARSATVNQSTLAQTYRERAAVHAAKAQDLERPSAQNYTPKRGRQWAQKRHEAADQRRAERAFLALADAWQHRPESVPDSLCRLFTSAEVLACVHTLGKSESYYHYVETDTYADHSPRALALRDFVRAWDKDAAQREAAVAKDRALREAVDKLRSWAPEGFFPSPPALVRRILDEAGIAPGMTVLEPGAGLGDIATAAVEAGADVLCIELLRDAVTVLNLKGLIAQQGDFLDEDPDRTPQRFDRVLMNPPFERGAAMKHVVHALRFLKPGGRLVAVLPASLTEDEVVKAIGGSALVELSEPLNGEFAKSDAFRNTGVSVKVLSVDMD